MAKRTTVHFLCLSLVFTSALAIQTLRYIKELKENTDFVKDFPQHGLMLLHWFAHNVEIDDSGVIQLNFDPELGHYGLHCYRNEIPDENPDRVSESRYYSLGDLNRGSARMLPFYVTQDFHNSLRSQHKNTDRVLIEVQSDSPKQVGKVYITQTFEDGSQGTSFDPNNTYEISAQLLIQIQALGMDITCDKDDPRLAFSPCIFLDHHQKALKLEMIYPKTPGLAWFLTLAGYNIDQRTDVLSTIFCTGNPTSSQNCCPLSMDDRESYSNVYYKIKLEVKTTPKGYAKIVWSGIPECIAKMEVNLGLYKDGTQDEPLKEYPLDGLTYGSIDTNLPLNPGLQVHLLRSAKMSYYLVFSTTYYTSIWKGPEFDESNGALPTRVKGYDMSLQLYTKDGYACARLYIKKSFANWKNVFDNSWVGFYASSLDDNDNYSKYEWVVNFEKKPEEHCPLDYDIYECESSLVIGPGVQVRLMLTQHVASEKARTVAWEESSTFKQ